MDDLETHPVPDDVARDLDAWELRVTGAVDRPLSLARDDLASLSDETVVDDFACVEGWKATDLAWGGVRCETLLERADPAAASEHALVRATDGDYACAFPLGRLSDALLAVELEGEPLPVEHGGPARLVPVGADVDCWEHVTWVAEIEVGEKPFREGDTAKDVALSRLE